VKDLVNNCFLENERYIMSESEDRLSPKNPGNARLLYIDEDLLSCDICDEPREAAVFDTIGGPSNSTTIHICKKCLEETLKRFDSGNVS